MFSYGYCYGDADVRGYNPSGVATTEAKAKRAIKRILGKTIPEERIFFKESETKKGNFRAWFKGPDTENRTNYVFFKLAETWALVDYGDAKKFIQSVGDLEDMKVEARNYTGRAGKLKRTGDHYPVLEGVSIVRII